MSSSNTGKAELESIIQEWDDNGPTQFGKFSDLVDALWDAGYRRVEVSD